MCVSSLPAGSGWVVRPSGEIDLATAPAMREELLRRLAHGPVVLDLSAVSFFDSAGLHVLVAAQRRAELVGNALAIARAGSIVLTVLRVTHVLELLDLHPSVGDALRALGLTEPAGSRDAAFLPSAMN